MRKAFGVMVVLVLAAGCAGSDEPAPSPSTPAPSTSTPTSAPTATPPGTATTKPPSAADGRLVGTVQISSEERCTVLATQSTAWVLTGAIGGLVDGDEVVVTGRADPDATTRCQRGPVFVVAEVVRDRG